MASVLKLAEKLRLAHGASGVLAALSNPKVILFFAAFLPQFINPNSDLWLQFLIMMLTFVLIGAGLPLSS